MDKLDTLGCWLTSGAVSDRPIFPERGKAAMAAVTGDVTDLAADGLSGIEGPLAAGERVAPAAPAGHVDPWPRRP